MATLISSIEEEAKTKLPLPKERHAILDLDPYRKFIKQQSHRLKIHHRGGAGGREICRAHSMILDLVLQNLWQRARNSLSPQAQKEFPPLALVAIGGFGRGELNPKSDLDVMLLHEGQVVGAQKALPHLSKMIDFILMPLYDLGFKVGHSVRTVRECVSLANEDMLTKTSLIESRLIAGDNKLFTRFVKTIVSKCVVNHVEGYIEERLKDQATRRKRFGDSPTMQEPNIKNGCGGLRDFQNLCWMAFFQHGTRSLKDLQEKEFLAPGEAKQLEKAYDYLLRARNELHHQVTRPVDAMSKSLQVAMATKLGFTDRSPSKRLEMFMKEFYMHTRNIYLITRTVEDRLSLLPRSINLPVIGRLLRHASSRAKAKSPTVDGFRIEGKIILPSSKRVFKDQPRRLMRVFLYAQQRGLSLHPDTAQLIRQDQQLVDRKFINDEGVRETFLEIMNQPGRVAATLRAMHEVGLLGKYIPEFGKMTCLVQHEFYHRYTADEHTLMCLAQLDTIWESSERPHVNYRPLLRELDRPYVLYLAMLLHDAGKAQGGGPHAAVGAELARKVARRLQLSEADTESLCLLIHEHLTMVHISQRRDLNDQTIMENFANQIGSLNNLNMLTLHSFADSMGTSEKLWNGFKDSLLWELHHKGREVMAGGTAFIREEARQMKNLAADLRKKLPKAVLQDEIDAHFETMPIRYFRIHPTAEIVSDLNLVHRFFTKQLAEDSANVLAPLLSWHNERDRGYTRVEVCSWDRPGLFSTISGALAASGINILSAEVFTRSDNVVLDKFFITDNQTGGLVGKARREEFEGLLKTASVEGSVDFTARLEKLQLAQARQLMKEVGAIPIRVQFDNRASDNRTVIEVQAQDRLGLLFQISSVMRELKLNITLAKIQTEKGGVVDSFYVHDSGGGKLESAARKKTIEKRLRNVLEPIEVK